MRLPWSFVWLLCGVSEAWTIDRRSALVSVAASLLAPSIDVASSQCDVYRVVSDASEALSPSLESLSVRGPALCDMVVGADCRLQTDLSSVIPQKDSFLEGLASSKGALWLGEHHNSLQDHLLQTGIIRELHSRRKGSVAIGLEQVQRQFQPVLDRFVAGRLTLNQLRNQVQWDTRWTWSFEVYEPLFQLAQERRIPLVALNVDSEDLALVERSGLPGLPQDRLQLYIPDAYVACRSVPLLQCPFRHSCRLCRPGFAAFAQPISYRTYVDYVIRPSYELHDAMGLLRNTMAGDPLEEKMSFRNFFSGRILWDEGMATAAYQFLEKRPDTLLVGLVGADHVKFRDGIPGRFERLAQDQFESVSVVLNPTLIDTRPAGTVGMSGARSDQPDSLTLQLRYVKEDIHDVGPVNTSSTGGVLPFSDFILIG